MARSSGGKSSLAATPLAVRHRTVTRTPSLPPSLHLPRREPYDFGGRGVTKRRLLVQQQRQPEPLHGLHGRRALANDTPSDLQKLVRETTRCRLGAGHGGILSDTRIARDCSLVSKPTPQVRRYLRNGPLSHSRKGFSEVVFRQTTDDFLRCLEDAFWHFGGVPQRLVLDNLRAAVTKADWFDPEINPQVQSFAEYYGIVLMPTRPYTPRHKGKIERGIDYVQENALRGRTFAGLEDQNRFLLEWERTVADTRLHGTTRKQVAAQFELEKPALRPLPDARFPCFREVKRTVHRDGHVEVEKAYYSVPTEYLGRRVWVRYDSRLVRIFDERMKLIATHVRHEPGRFSTQSSHIAGPKIACIERGLDWLMGRVRRIGPNSRRWAEAVVASRGVQAARVLQGLLNLAKRHSSSALERACDTAASRGADHLRTIRKLLERPAPDQESLPFLEDHPVIRHLSEYGRFVETHDTEVGDE
jgi:Integrase core domain